jgi:MFS family permease
VNSFRFDVFRDRRLLNLWLAQGVSVFGDMLTFLAIPMLVYEATGSKAALSLAVFIRGIPTLLIGPFAGALADRWDRRRIMIASDLLMALLTVPIVLAEGAWMLPTIYVVVGIKAVIGTFFQPALSSVIPSLVARERLMPVNSFFSFTFQTLQFLAPLAGSVLAATVGIKVLLLIDILSFLISAWLIGRIQIPAHPECPCAAVTVKGLLADIRAGLVHIRESKLLGVMLLTAVITQFGQGFINPAWIPYMVEVLKTSAESFGVLVSLQGLGCMVGSIFLLVLGVRNWIRTKALYMFYLAGSGITIFMQVTTTHLPVFMIWGTLVGFFIAGRGIASNTLIQHAADQAMMGRVNSTFQILSQSAMMLAVLVASLSSDWMTTRFLFVLACSLWLAGCLLGTLLMAFVPESKHEKTV